ncbi:hypothetical protein BAUCODRAFT_38572, partial [Baudoinia panamericana UAMH 10762]
MVKFYSSTYSYDHPFPAVSLAYFLRYPNPYSKHVASTDTISRSFDPATQRLTTVRLHLKRSRLPPAVLKLLPSSVIGSGADGTTQSFILETSVIDVREGWMETESRNLNWCNVLSVIERHSFRRPDITPGHTLTSPDALTDRTDVSVSVTLKSRIGEQLRKRRQRWGETATPTSVAGVGAGAGVGEEDDPSELAAWPAKQGFFGSWSSTAARSAIESISLQRTEKSQAKARKGVGVVLTRLGKGGIQAVLEGMRADGEVVA